MKTLKRVSNEMNDDGTYLIIADFISLFGLFLTPNSLEVVSDEKEGGRKYTQSIDIGMGPWRCNSVSTILRRHLVIDVFPFPWSPRYKL